MAQGGAGFKGFGLKEPASATGRSMDQPGTAGEATRKSPSLWMKVILSAHENSSALLSLSACLANASTASSGRFKPIAVSFWAKSTAFRLGNDALTMADIFEKNRKSIIQPSSTPISSRKASSNLWRSIVVTNSIDKIAIFIRSEYQPSWLYSTVTDFAKFLG